MPSLPFELPLPGESRQRVGYSVSVRSTGLPMLSIAHWSDELEAMLGALPEVSVGVAGSLRGVFADLPRLAPYADRIVAFSAHEEVRGDLSLVNDFTNLRELSTHAKAKGIELRSFTRLWRCLLDGAWDLAGLAASAGTLEELHLEGGKAVTLAALAPLHALRELSLWSTSKLESFDGIEGLPIEELRVYQAGALRSVRAVTSLTALRVLSLDGARGVADLDAIGDAAALEELMLAAAGTAPSFDFVARLARLRVFHFEGTEVAAAPASLTPFAGLRSLRTLRLRSGLRHATDVERLGELHELEVLVLEGLPSVASVAWMGGFTRVRCLHLDAAVEDGDLSPIAALPRLGEVRLGRHRKHHSHTQAQLKAIIEARHPEIVAAREERDRMLREVSEEAQRKGYIGVSTPAPAPPPTPETAPKTVGGLPTAVMRDVPWRFSTSAATRDEVVAAVEAELREGDSSAVWDADALVLPAPRLRVRIPGFGNGEEEDGSDQDAVLELITDDARGFSAAGLLFRLHEAAAPLVGGTDYRYFEGLVLLDAGDGGVPTYELRLGS